MSNGRPISLRHGKQTPTSLIAALGAVMRRRNLTSAGWAAAAGVPSSALYNLFSGRAKSLNIRTLEKLAAAAGVGIDELTSPEPPAYRRRRELPALDFVQAGDWAEITQALAANENDMVYLAPDVPVGPRAFALEIRGRSMAPDFQDGDRIIVDPDVQANPGDYVVAKRLEDESSTFKQLRVLPPDEFGRPVYELVPINKDWPPITIDANHPGEIVGVVVEHRRAFRSRG